MAGRVAPMLPPVAVAGRVVDPVRAVVAGRMVVSVRADPDPNLDRNAAAPAVAPVGCARFSVIALVPADPPLAGVRIAAGAWALISGAPGRFSR